MDLDNNGQPVKDPVTDPKQPEAKNTFDLGDGNMVTLEELKKSHTGYKSLQSDYTKKSQELSELKKPENKPSEEDMAAIEALKKAGFTTVDEFQQFKKEHAEKEEYSNFAGVSGLSETQLKMVSDLKQVYPDKSFGDIAKDSGLIDEAKLNKVKGSHGFKGGSFALPEKKEPFKVDVTTAGYNPEQAAIVAKMKF